jgi:hypothetical protein
VHQSSIDGVSGFGATTSMEHRCCNNYIGGASMSLEILAGMFANDAAR